MLPSRSALLLLAAALAAFLPAPAFADEALVAPDEHLTARNIPPIPASLAARIAPYTEFKPRTAVSWHPVERTLVVASRAGNALQLHRVRGPGAPLEQLTDLPDPVRAGRFLPKKPEALLFAHDTGGNEQTQLYRVDAPGATPVRLTDPDRRHAIAAFTHARDRLLLETTELDKTGRREAPATTLALLDPLAPERMQRVAELPGTGWGDFTFAFDDKRVAMVEGRSATDARVWVMELATGKRRRLLPAQGAGTATRIASSELQFARDGRGLFLATDRDGEFQRLAYLDLARGKLAYFGPKAAWDVERIRLSPDGRTLAVVTNEAGEGVLRLYDAATRRERARPALPVGTITSVVWHDNARDLAVSVNAATTPGDVWVVDARTSAVERWTTTSVEGLDAAQFRVPQPIRWTSFDGRAISGFVTRPPARFAGPRPVLISIHGGPESQARPNFAGRANFFLDVLGIAVIEPNVRGSTGFGKTFVSLDDGPRREDSVRDIGALLDWIATQPDLDPKRVVVAGGSYGGYMSLAVATHYGDRLAGAVDVVGIANFVTFLERTESYRRDLRRVEYGDERDPAMREILTRISPVTNAARIATPLFVVHGRNDPRVPYTEAEQIVDIASRNGRPVWYLLADNEGHGFQRKVNADFYFFALVRFLETTLSVSAAPASSG